MTATKPAEYLELQYRNEHTHGEWQDCYWHRVKGTLTNDPRPRTFPEAVDWTRKRTAGWDRKTQFRVVAVSVIVQLMGQPFDWRGPR